jgi:hypothetical protein
MARIDDISLSLSYPNDDVVSRDASLSFGVFHRTSHRVGAFLFREQHNFCSVPIYISIFGSTDEQHPSSNASLSFIYFLPLLYPAHFSSSVDATETQQRLHSGRKPIKTPR